MYDATRHDTTWRSRSESSAATRALRTRIERLLEGSGVALDGTAPWDIRVNDPRLYGRTLSRGSLGFGDAYVDGWWDSDDLAGCLERLIRHGSDHRSGRNVRRLVAARYRLRNVQRGSGSWAVGRRHYDLGDDLVSRVQGLWHVIVRLLRFQSARQAVGDPVRTSTWESMGRRAG